MGIAVLRISSQLPRYFRVLPVGRFSAADGRQDGSWHLPAGRGQQIAALTSLRQAHFLIDFEHASLKSNTAPEAGRFHRLEWRDDGLYVTDAVWSEEAKQLIASGKKRFISPVFRYDSATKEVLDLESIALTEDPALLGLTDLSQVAVNSAQRPSTAPAPGDSMTAEERAKFEHVFGASPEALQAREPQVPKAPAGVNAEDWAKLHHVFGDSLRG